MSKVYEKKTIPSEYTIIVQHKCDLCGRETDGEDWSTNTYEVNETEITVTISQKEGNHYPESYYATGYEIDLCPWCFKNKLIPWLKSEGADIKEEKWSDW